MTSAPDSSSTVSVLEIVVPQGAGVSRTTRSRCWQSIALEVDTIKDECGLHEALQARASWVIVLIQHSVAPVALTSKSASNTGEDSGQKCLGLARV